MNFNSEQRQLLDDVKAFAGKGSLIPPHLNYRQHLRSFEHQTTQAGLPKTHGVRHAYAQRRYESLTGWQCPIAGGPSRNSLPIAERETDEAARLQIAEELGHGRIDISKNYLDS